MQLKIFNKVSQNETGERFDNTTYLKLGVIPCFFSVLSLLGIAPSHPLRALSVAICSFVIDGLCGGDALGIETKTTPAVKSEAKPATVPDILLAYKSPFLQR